MCRFRCVEELGKSPNLWAGSGKVRVLQGNLVEISERVGIV
jgi:hypothetical protein